MKKLIPLFIIVFIFFTSCNTEKIKRLNSELQGVTDTLGLCQTARTYYQVRIDSCNQVIQQYQSAIFQDSIKLVNYFSQHKTAVACIAGGFVSAKVKTDFKTNYPQVVEDFALLGLVVSALYYLFNKDEVDNVYNASIEGNNRKKLMRSYIYNCQQFIYQEYNSLTEIDNLEEIYQNRASILRSQLAELQ